MNGVTIVIPTRNGGPLFATSIRAIAGQRFDGPRQVLVIDSGSTDGTDERAREAGASVRSIAPSEFHHARTRNLALRDAEHPAVVFTVQDAIPADDGWLARCVDVLRDVAAAFGRQIPHADADLFGRFATEQFARYLGDAAVDYPIRGLQDTYEDALRGIRFDNVCAVYRRDALERIPFPEVGYGEDMAWSRAAQAAGHRLRYDPSIRVFHSHDRPASYHFRRSLVETIGCSRLLERLPDRRDPVPFARIVDLERRAPEFDAELAKWIHERPSPIRKLAARAATRLRRNGDLARECLERSRNLIWEIQRRHPDADEAQWSACIPKVAATIRGQIVGQAYLGARDAEFDSYVQQNTGGI